MPAGERSPVTTSRRPDRPTTSSRSATTRCGRPGSAGPPFELDVEDAGLPADRRHQRMKTRPGDRRQVAVEFSESPVGAGPPASAAPPSRPPGDAPRAPASRRRSSAHLSGAYRARRRHRRRDDDRPALRRRPERLDEAPAASAESATMSATRTGMTTERPEATDLHRSRVASGAPGGTSPIDAGPARPGPGEPRAECDSAGAARRRDTAGAAWPRRQPAGAATAMGIAPSPQTSTRVVLIVIALVALTVVAALALAAALAPPAGRLRRPRRRRRRDRDERRDGSNPGSAPGGSPAPRHPRPPA